MDLRLTACQDVSFEEPILGPRLDQAHNRLLDYFQNSFTADAWKMFEPIS